MLLIVLNLPFSCPVCYHWLAETNSSQTWVFCSERGKAAVWKENLNQLSKCCRTPLVFRLWHEEVSKAWRVCHASWRHVLVRLVAVLTSHANLAMTQGTGYVLSDAIFCSISPLLPWCLLLLPGFYNIWNDNVRNDTELHHAGCCHRRKRWLRQAQAVWTSTRALSCLIHSLITAAGPMIFPSAVLYFWRGGLFEWKY